MKKIIISILLFISGHANSACDQFAYNNNFPSSKGHIETICRQRFAAGFSAEHKISLWVSELLLKENLLKPEVKRSDDFQPDPSIKLSRQSSSIAFRNSGYDRGHLVPFENVADDKIAAKESFYFTNIVPQVPAQNRGIWKSLENKARKIALQEGRVYIITGVIIDSTTLKMSDGTTIPSEMWKVIIIPGKKLYDAYLIPNSDTVRTLNINRFRVTIREIEQKTGLTMVDKRVQLRRAK